MTKVQCRLTNCSASKFCTIISQRILCMATAVVFVITACNNNQSVATGKAKIPVDKAKRDALVSKYDLLKFPAIKQPVLLTIDEFFDGNNDESSIAPNLEKKPPIATYYSILKAIAQNPKTFAVFAEIKDVMIYDNGKLNDNEWFYTDIIYFVGDLTKEEIKEATKTLLPDEVEYENESVIKEMGLQYKNKKVVYIWWD
ncbi:MAG TPA: hypothetical protein PKC72_15975 [Chitinophagaceae bacterium]|nr:hypothetical protein [Chitinophagaceae bacterium]